MLAAAIHTRKMRYPPHPGWGFVVGRATPCKNSSVLHPWQLGEHDPKMGHRGRRAPKTGFPTPTLYFSQIPDIHSSYSYYILHKHEAHKAVMHVTLN